MINVIFYGFSDDQYYGTDLSVNIADRFNMDYPDTDVRVIFDEDEEEFKIIFDIDVIDIDEVDTFLCEEIAQEYEVYCEILNDYNCNSKSYYYDEEDKWFYE